MREIQGHLEEMYGTEVSPSLISSITDAVSEEVKVWQSRPLDATHRLPGLHPCQSARWCCAGQGRVPSPS